MRNITANSTLAILLAFTPACDDGTGNKAAPTPSFIHRITPAWGHTGDPVRLEGFDFGNAGTASVMGTTAPISSWGATGVTIRLPESNAAGRLAIQLFTSDGRHSNRAAIYRAAPGTWVPFLASPAGFDDGAWTGQEMLLWNAREPRGLRYHPPSDAWMSMAPFPLQRRFPAVAVWTGTKLFVWRGASGKEADADGASYDPLADAWSPASSTNAPQLPDPRAVAIAGRVLVWGDPNDETYLYNPDAGQWETLPKSGRPSACTRPHLLAAGDTVILWCGAGPWGARFDLRERRWQRISTAGAPPARHFEGVGANPSGFLVWGGSEGGHITANLTDGAFYSVEFDRWTPVPAPKSFRPRKNPQIVWLHGRWLVYGGFDADCSDPEFSCRPEQALALYDAATFDFRSNTWRAFVLPVPRLGRAVPMGADVLFLPARKQGASAFRYITPAQEFVRVAPAGVPLTARDYGKSVWTGTHAFWLGPDVQRYDPATDTWTTVPTPHQGDTGALNLVNLLWTGTEVFAQWPGGEIAFLHPLTLAWRTMAVRLHVASAVWTGSEIITWGNRTPSALPGTGQRLHALTGATSSTSQSTVTPSARWGHSIVWTGEEAAVWGGDEYPWTPTGTGALYHPGTDAWRPMSSARAPSSREFHCGVWTGSRMLIWRGFPRPTTTTGDTSRIVQWQDGARYDPVNDHWEAMTPRNTAQRPTRSDAYLSRNFESPVCVWNGERMLSWSEFGWEFPDHSESGIYDPAADVWTPITRTEAASTVSAWRGIPAWIGSAYLFGGYGMYFP